MTGGVKTRPMPIVPLESRAPLSLDERAMLARMWPQAESPALFPFNDLGLYEQQAIRAMEGTYVLRVTGGYVLTLHGADYLDRAHPDCGNSITGGQGFD